MKKLLFLLIPGICLGQVMPTPTGGGSNTGGATNGLTMAQTIAAVNTNLSAGVTGSAGTNQILSIASSITAITNNGVVYYVGPNGKGQTNSVTGDPNSDDGWDTNGYLRGGNVLSQLKTNATAAAQVVASNAMPVITISPKGIANGLSAVVNDGKMYGPDTPGTTTCGWQEMINAFPYATNNGPVTPGAFVMVNPGYYYFTNQIYYTNNHPFDLTIQGAGIAGSKLVYAGSTVFGTTNVDYSVNPTAMGNATIVFEPGTNATSLINKHLHLQVNDMGFTAMTNTTNVLVYVDGQNVRGGYSYCDFERCDFESWYALTNQSVGAVLSKEWPGTTPVGVNIPGLVGLWINSMSEHETMINNCFFAGLAVGAYIQVDHLESQGLKFAYVGVDPGAPSAGVTNQWGTNYIFSLGAAAIFSCAQFPEIINFGHCWVSPGGAVLYGSFSGEFNNWIFETSRNAGVNINTIAATGTNLPNFFNEYDYNLGKQITAINEVYAPGNSIYTSTGYQMAVGTVNPYALTMNANQQGAANPFDINIGGTNVFSLSSTNGFLLNAFINQIQTPVVSTTSSGSPSLASLGLPLAIGGTNTTTLGGCFVLTAYPNTNYIYATNTPTSTENGLFTWNGVSFYTNVNGFSNYGVGNNWIIRKASGATAITNAVGIGPVGIGTWTNTQGLTLATISVTYPSNTITSVLHTNATGFSFAP